MFGCAFIAMTVSQNLRLYSPSDGIEYFIGPRRFTVSFFAVHLLFVFFFTFFLIFEIFKIMFTFYYGLS